MTSKQIRIYYLNRQLERVDAAIAHHELRAAIPPASCSQIELFTATELGFAQAYRMRAADIRDEIMALEGQMELRLLAS